MPGFGNIAEYANADDNGCVWFTQFRKLVSSAATTTYNYVDYTYFSGSPLANFYASTPLEAAYVDPSRGIFIPSVSPAKQFLKNITVMTNSSGATSQLNQMQKLSLCDYLLYYPFVDTDSIDQQDLIQTVSIPRYTSGRVMAIAQSASSAVGAFTITYTNQNGVSGQVSPLNYTQIVSGGGQSLLSYNASVSGLHPFLQLAAGDTGVRSIESVTFTTPGGGLMALVIVEPLLTFYANEACRRTTSGNLESYGSAVSVDSVIHNSATPEIKDGAVLGLISKANFGSLASSTLVGYIETTWN